MQHSSHRQGIVGHLAYLDRGAKAPDFACIESKPAKVESHQQAAAGIAPGDVHPWMVSALLASKDTRPPAKPKPRPRRIKKAKPAWFYPWLSATIAERGAEQMAKAKARAKRRG
jgi:hypothetical protein